ncbi:MAG: dihydropteroate synthase, partial [Clostridiales bacterium]
MGIVNMTPDSFFDGGKYNTVAQGIAQVKALVAAGADLIDIGGASSRPGFNPVAADTELMRVLPLISELVPWLEVPISIDTDKIEVAAAAVAAGVAVLNYTGVLNQNILRLAKDSHAPVVLMHQGGGADVLESVGGFFREALAMAAQVGLEREQIILDPGIGFDKNPQENIRILAH